MENIFTETMKMAAINFAEWIANEFWILSSNDLWYKKSDGNPDEGLTTEEIYELFLESERNRIKLSAENISNEEQDNGDLSDVGRIISFNTYGKNDRVMKGKIIESKFDNELKYKYYTIKPLEDFNGYKTIVRTEKEVF